MSLRSAYSTIFQPVLQDGSPFQGQINAAIPGNVAIGDSNTAYTLSINNQTITSASGNLNISGNISATGSLTVSAATISNALNVSGLTNVSALNVRNFLNVSGLTSLSNVNICGGVNITGNTYLNSNLEVKRSLSAESVYSTTLSGVVNINGAPYIAGGNPFNWSTLPAISDVNMSGYSILGVSNLNVSGSVSINGNTVINSGLSAESVYSTTLSGVTLINGAPYIPGVNPANWATFPAVANVSMGGFNIGNTNAVSVSGRLVVDGSATINGLVRLSNANISGLLNVSGGNVQNKWNVSGQLNAENASIVANLGVSGNAILSNASITALYGGATTLSSLSVQSNVSISGETLLVGKVTVSDVLNVSGLSTISGLTVQNTLSAGILYSTTLVGVSSINGTEFNPAGIPSNWANYGAVSDVNLSGNDIYNVDNLNVSGLSVFAGGLSIPAIATISHADVIGNLSSSNIFISNSLSASNIFVSNSLSASNIFVSNSLSASKIYVSSTAQSSNLSSLQLMTYNTVTSQIQANSNITISGGVLGVGTTTSNSAYGLVDINGDLRVGTNTVAAINFCRTGTVDSNRRSYIYHNGTDMEITNQQPTGYIAVQANTGAGGSIYLYGNGGVTMTGTNFVASNVTESSNSSNLKIMTYNPATSQLQQNSNVTISGGNLFVSSLAQSSNLSSLQLMTYNTVTSQIQRNSNITISGGAVGIGTLAPETKLTIGTRNDSWYYVPDPDSLVIIGNSVSTSNTGSQSGGNLKIFSSNAYARNMGGTITLGGRMNNFGGGNVYASFARISGVQASSTDTYAGDLVFHTQDSGTLYERMRINSAGTVGISGTVVSTYPFTGPSYTNIRASAVTNVATTSPLGLNGAYNVTNITRSIDGRYRVNFTNPVSLPYLVIITLVEEIFDRTTTASARDNNGFTITNLNSGGSGYDNNFSFVVYAP